MTPPLLHPILKSLTEMFCVLLGTSSTPLSFQQGPVESMTLKVFRLRKKWLQDHCDKACGKDLKRPALTPNAGQKGQKWGTYTCKS